MIYTIFVFTYLVAAMVFLIPLGFSAMLFYFLGFRKSMTLVMYRFAQGWALSIIKITGCKVIVTGRENIPKKGSVCFVSNHDGYFDILLLLAYCGRPYGFISKKELAFVPFLNAWIYMLGGLFIDRKNVRKAMRTMNKGIKRIKDGGGMIIFPEGTRSRGRGLLPFHSGSLKLATAANAPIIPIAIKGSYEVFEKNLRFTRATLNVAFCEPVCTAELPPSEKKQVLVDRIYSIIKDKLDNF